LRFIHYFEAFYKKIIISPQIKLIKKIEIIGVPNMAGGFASSPSCKPFFQIFEVKGLYNNKIYDSRHDD
jgi:hypothetical protein